jgi:hypothetical protein
VGGNFGDMFNIFNKPKIECPRCLGKGHVDSDDIKRLKKELQWLPGECAYCNGKGKVAPGLISRVNVDATYLTIDKSPKERKKLLHGDRKALLRAKHQENERNHFINEVEFLHFGKNMNAHEIVDYYLKANADMPESEKQELLLDINKVIRNSDGQKAQIKSRNEEIISQKGYRVNSWLPYHASTSLRSIDEIKGRSSVMSALVNISFGAPTEVIKQWILQHGLKEHLSNNEKEILRKSTANLTELETNSLSWYLESMWAFLWVMKMIDSLEPEQHVDDSMASLVPNLQEGENNDKIAVQNSLQPEIELYTMRDYYFRLHWYCVDERFNSREIKLNEGLVYERRRALEWTLDKDCDWDNIEMGT